MKKMWKAGAALLALTMAAGLAGCGNQAAQQTQSGDSGAGAGATYTVGIVQLTPHEALDQATQGFQDALKEEFGDQVVFDYQNAANDPATCSTIANGFVSAGVDLIMANASSAVQAAASATGTIPVLGTSVTEYGVALGIENFSGTVGTNVSGTSDLAPLDQQAAMIQEWCPDAKTVGLLFCSAEANSQYQVDTVQAFLEELGYTCTQYPFSDSNDMAAVTQTAADNSDVIYVPTDNTVASNASIVDNICRPAKIPVFAGEQGICLGCGVATLSISYYDLGVTTGQMAIKILKGEADISQMPIEYAPQFTKMYNQAICDDLGLTPPEGYTAIPTE
ncbi:ABC transporter substrate-binding protein [Pseudoflavonifractor sp. An85]|uniref:ABC transporter substrate-binding protein n=1 Tax=Pseudoflavonifractor sp. An85 TaxID=1965661 RepID=UPI000B3A95DD|nr:ABC transporter substrate-binding protein [Pseudoflavonifractor sp. An85]OUN24371.1 ABC transporter substrate-binding protein [Pseudoflavonifractor sp. An85]